MYGGIGYTYYGKYYHILSLAIFSSITYHHLPSPDLQVLKIPEAEVIIGDKGFTQRVEI